MSLNIPARLIQHLSKLKFDGKGGTTISDDTPQFLKFYDFYEVNYEDVSCKLFNLTLKGRVKKWCHSLPCDFIHSLEQLFKELHQAFDRYDYQNVYKRISQLTMRPNESLDDFMDRFLHLFYEFSKEYVDWDFMNENFQCLVYIS